MSNIVDNLKTILQGRYGKDVRQAIHDAIQDCYEDGKAGATDLEARQTVDALVPRMDELETQMRITTATAHNAGQVSTNAISISSRAENVANEVSRVSLKKEEKYNFSQWEEAETIINAIDKKLDSATFASNFASIVRSFADLDKRIRENQVQFTSLHMPSSPNPYDLQLAAHTGKRIAKVISVVGIGNAWHWRINVINSDPDTFAVRITNETGNYEGGVQIAFIEDISEE